MKDYLIKDNFFSDVDIVREIALNAKYYLKDKHPGDIGHFPGLRTDYINVWNNQLYTTILEAEIDCVEKLLNLKLSDRFKEYWTKFSFSLTTQDTPIQEHRDFTDNWNGFTHFYGGVIYLTPNPPKNSGTILKDVTTIENVYNRYVMYDATELHSVESSFGKDINDARLVLTHFIFLK